MTMDMFKKQHEERMNVTGTDLLDQVCLVPWNNAHIVQKNWQHPSQRGWKLSQRTADYCLNTKKTVTVKVCWYTVATCSKTMKFIQSCTKVSGQSNFSTFSCHCVTDCIIYCGQPVTDWCQGLDRLACQSVTFNNCNCGCISYGCFVVTIVWPCMFCVIWQFDCILMVSFFAHLLKCRLTLTSRLKHLTHRPLFVEDCL